MAVKGSQAKEAIIQKLMEVFPDAFAYEKEIRIPMEENGETVEIKVTLTCAKVNVGNANRIISTDTTPAFPAESSEITPEEKSNVIDLVTRLGL